jgi:hypothetical protein
MTAWEREIKLAEDFVNSWFPSTEQSWRSRAARGLAERFATILKEGRQEERARCAAVARKYAGDPGETYGSNDAAFDMSVRIGIAIAKSIAKAIENATVSDLSDATQGVPSRQTDKNDQG